MRMPRDAEPCDTADLVARVEQVKRNREIILRTIRPKPLASVSPRPAVGSRDAEPGVCVCAGEADLDSET